MSAHCSLDISSTSIKVAQATNNRHGFELLAFGEVKTPASLQSDDPQDDAMIAKAIKQLLAESGIKSNEVYLTIPETLAYTRVIQMPILNSQELDNALKYESEQYVPIPLSEVYLEHQVLYTPPPGSAETKMEVLLVAAKKKAIEKMIRIVELAELTPMVLETALIAAIRGLHDHLSDYSMLVDIGNSSTDIAIIQKGNLKQVSSISTAGEALTRVIAQGLGLTEQQARQYKHVYGLEEDQLEGKIAQVLDAPLTTIVNHIAKNVRFAKTLDNEGHVDLIVLAGGTALLPNLSRYLVDKLGIEVNLANPMRNCTNHRLPPELVAAAPRFASVIGLAIRP